MKPACIGIDLGTQGVRVVALDEAGVVAASVHETFLDFASPEQDPDAWWSATGRLLGEVVSRLQSQRLVPVSVSVTGTSGTIVPLDRDNRPVAGALMYHDTRGRDVAGAIAGQTGAPLDSSWALPKIAWFTATFPELAHRVARWRHPTDFILGRITGEWAVTDETSALKTGYDPETQDWRSAVLAAAGIDLAALPAVVGSGVPIGHPLPAVARATGLPAHTIVTTGMTDGCASQVSSGAVTAGAWNTTLGTTMVIKGTTARALRDPHQRVYSHRHPDGLWLPGAASNTGAGWISIDYPGADLERLDADAARHTPTGKAVYPLRLQSERFPFVAPQASGFEPPALDPAVRYAAGLEGVAYLERMAYSLFEDLSGVPIPSIVSSGGGSRSDTWLQIRSDVLQRPIVRARHGEAAVGAAIVGASRTMHASLLEAVSAMTRPGVRVEPRSGLSAAYDNGYAGFLHELDRRGYIEAGAYR